MGRRAEGARPVRRRLAAGFTLLEVVSASAVCSLLVILCAQVAVTGTRCTTLCSVEQSASREAGRLLQRIVGELSAADPASVVCWPSAPGTILFQQVLATHVDEEQRVQRVLSRPVTLRRILLPASALLAVERCEPEVLADPYLAMLLSSETSEDELDATTVRMCTVSAVGQLTTVEVPLSELPTRLAAGDTFGPCASPPRVLGAYVAPCDPDLRALPGVHYHVERDDRWTRIDVVVAVEVRGPDGTVARERLTATVRLPGGAACDG